MVTIILCQILERCDFRSLDCHWHVGRQTRLINVDEHESHETPGDSNQTDGSMTTSEPSTCENMYELYTMGPGNRWKKPLSFTLIGDCTKDVHERIVHSFEMRRIGVIVKGNEAVFLLEGNHQVNETDYSNYRYYQINPYLRYVNLCFILFFMSSIVII